MRGELRDSFPSVPHLVEYLIFGEGPPPPAKPVDRGPVPVLPVQPDTPTFELLMWLGARG